MRQPVPVPDGMEVAVFHGTPRKGNTHLAAALLMDELSACGNVHCTEFFLPEALPGFCTGCALCLGGRRGQCPHARHVTPIADAILRADALVFATPHYGACGMTGAMKNLLDHLDFFVLNVSPSPENFRKKALVLTTGAGSAAAARPIRKFLRHWGINRVYALSFRLLTNEWGNMPPAKQQKFARRIRRAARAFAQTPVKRPYLSTIFYYHFTKMILRKYVGEGNYPYDHWKERGYFNKRPF